MAGSTPVPIPCPANEWTQVSTGSANVLVQCTPDNGGGLVGFRVAVDTSTPGDGVVGIFAAAGDQGFSGKGLGGTDNVYVYPLSGDMLANVITS